MPTKIPNKKLIYLPQMVLDEESQKFLGIGYTSILTLLLLFVLMYLIKGGMSEDGDEVDRSRNFSVARTVC